MAWCPPDSSLETRLTALQANIETLKTELAETARELREETTKQIEALSSERQTLELAITKLRTQLDTLGAGNLHLEWAGVLWLTVGVVLATVPSGIAGVLKWGIQLFTPTS